MFGFSRFTILAISHLVWIYWFYSANRPGLPIWLRLSQTPQIWLFWKRFGLIILVWLFWLFLGFFRSVWFLLYIWFFFIKIAEKSPSSEKNYQNFLRVPRDMWTLFSSFWSRHRKDVIFCAVLVVWPNMFWIIWDFLSNFL